MNKIYCIIINVLFLSSAFGQHRIGVTFDGATAWQLDNVEITTPQIGGSIGVGAIYQYQYGRLLLNTGVSLSTAYLSQFVDSQHIAVPMRDTEGINFIYRGEVYNRRDQMLITELSIPLMLGARLRRFYALGGVRFLYPLVGLSSSKALMTTKGDYGNRYYEMLENMPQHGYFTALSIGNDKEKISFPMNFNVCAEFGYSWSIGNKRQGMQVGAFVEYNVLNSLQDATNSLMDVDCSQYMQVTMHHIYATLPRKSHFMRQLSVGVRVALFFSAGKGNEGDIFGDIGGDNQILIRRTLKK